MKKIIGFISLCFVIQITQLGINAQSTVVYEGLTYYLNKAEAFDAAREQGKKVFLLWGSDACVRCNQTKYNLANSSLSSLLDNYILWYCKTDANSTINTKDSPDVADYLSHLELAPFPAVCVIELSDIKKANGLRVGNTMSVNALYSLLSQYVDNDFIVGDKNTLVNIYTNDNCLIISNSIENETLSIYTASGSLVEKFTKTELFITRSLSGYPKGVLFIISNSGWTQKIVIK